MTRVLLTGHGGFVGHHCLEYFLANTDWQLICIDSFRHKGTIRRVVEVADDPRITTFKHDLAVPIDPQLESLLVQDGEIDIIINMASESAVERSTQDPVNCVRNNVDLALNMLEFARRRPQLQLFVQISTDEVYGECPPNATHKEWDAIVPSNAYAGSKAAQEALAIAYWRSYNLPIILTNCMNLIGERQNPEKFLPKLVQRIANGEEMPIYGDSPDKIGSRVYLHAKNLADALIFLSGIQPKLYSDFVTCDRPYEAKPDRYNICGDTELNNLELGQMVAGIMGKELKYRLVPSESARPGYDRRYGLDGSKLRSMGWEAPVSFQESLRRIVEFTLSNPHWLV